MLDACEASPPAGPKFLTFTLTEDEYVDAALLAAAPRRWQWLAAGGLALAVGAGLIYLASIDWRPAAALAVVSVVVMIVFPFIRLRVVLPMQRRREYRCFAPARLARGIAILPDGVALETEKGMFALHWEDLMSWRHNARMILLCAAPRSNLPIPTRLAREGLDIMRIREAAEAAAGPPVR